MLTTALNAFCRLSAVLSFAGLAFALINYCRPSDIGTILMVLSLSEAVASLAAQMTLMARRETSVLRLLSVWGVFILIVALGDSVLFDLGSERAAPIVLILLALFRSIQLIHGAVSSVLLWPSMAATITTCLVVFYNAGVSEALTVFLVVNLIATFLAAYSLVYKAPCEMPKIEGLKYSDILLVPVFLNPVQAGVYLLARGSVHIAHIGNWALEDSVRSNIRNEYIAGQQKFRAVAARLNIGYLLVGGAMIVALLAIMSTAAKFVPVITPSTFTAMQWLLGAFGLGAALGATSFLMRVTRLSIYDSGLRVLSGVTFVGLLVGSEVNDATAFAKAVAISVTIRYLVGAIILIRLVGVWPGLTGLLHREIKLR